MIKVIGGTYRSRVLDTPPETTTLPTKNMVRGAMISSCSSSLHGAKVLDLFAGSGALGIEALSQGAAWCDFAEIDSLAASIVAKNLKTLNIQNASLTRADFRSALKQKKGQVYDLVFLDPPYAEKGYYQEAVSFLLENRMLSSESAIFLEYEGELQIDLSPFSRVRTYTYGKSKVMALWRLS